jgi:hypothetical protein
VALVGFASVLLMGRDEPRPEPKYPDGKVLPVGRCERGWISFPVPPGKRPTTVLYRPITEVHAWAVPPV